MSSRSELVIEERKREEQIKELSKQLEHLLEYDVPYGTDALWSNPERANLFLATKIFNAKG